MHYALTGLANRNEIDRFCASLIDSLLQPTLYEDQQLHIGASLGISQTRLLGFDPGELIRCADIALYQAKAEGKNTWRYFSVEMNQQIQYRRQLESDLRRAVVQAIINLGLTVTAEGVETEQQLRALGMEQCQEVQGFYLSRPLEREAFEALLRTNRSATPDAGAAP